jgi:predicted acylesterase/phospholipase RssA
VLGGGGLGAGVFEVGALRALDLLCVDRTVNQFDVYVGTSAGAVVAALAITLEEMMRIVDARGPSPFSDLSLGTALRPDVLGLARAGALLPLRALALGRRVVGQIGAISAFDVLLALAEGMPRGLYSGAGLEDIVRTVLSDPDRTDDFRELDVELYVTATDLDTGERVVFGTEEEADTPISTAVRASTALPRVYAPVRLHGRELVDGAVSSTTNVDLAVEAGATSVVFVNPLVPYVSTDEHISRRGFPHVGHQAF